MRFGDWLREQKDRDDYVGDLARLMIEEEIRFSDSRVGCCTVVLMLCGCSETVIDPCVSAWVEWRRVYPEFKEYLALKGGRNEAIDPVPVTQYSAELAINGSGACPVCGLRSVATFELWERMADATFNVSFCGRECWYQWVEANRCQT